MDRIFSLVVQISLVIALVTLGGQAARAEAPLVGNPVAPAAISSLIYPNQSWLRQTRPNRRVSVPGTLLSLGAGLGGFIAWRSLRRRTTPRQQRPRSLK